MSDTRTEKEKQDEWIHERCDLKANIREWQGTVEKLEAQLSDRRIKRTLLDDFAIAAMRNWSPMTDYASFDSDEAQLVATRCYGLAKAMMFEHDRVVREELGIKWAEEAYKEAVEKLEKHDKREAEAQPA